jgi:hypothetical protein
MPYSPTNDAANIAQLGRDVKIRRANSGEQFCAFAFDLDHWLQLTPPVSERNRDECLTTDGGEPPKWLAAFFALTDPMHTEQALLDKFEQWYSDYQGMYGRPGTLYIYSFLIPCLRDGRRGHCADAIASLLLTLKQQRGIELKVRMGWSNNDVDSDMAGAIRTGFADLEDDQLDVHIYQVSIR